MTTNILELTDARGNLVCFRLTPGQGYDSVEVPPLIDGIAFDGLIASKAFDNNPSVAKLNERCPHRHARLQNRLQLRGHGVEVRAKRDERGVQDKFVL